MAKRNSIDSGQYLRGLSDVLEGIQNAADHMEQKSVQGLADALIFVGSESQKRAPVEFGDLRGSLEIDIDGNVIAKGVPSGLSKEEKAQRRRSGSLSAEAGRGLTILSDPPEKGSVGTISYNTPYAADQHEHTEYDHPLGGQAKYLETVLTSEKDRILELIAGAIINDLEGF